MKNSGGIDLTLIYRVPGGSRAPERGSQIRCFHVSVDELLTGLNSAWKQQGVIIHTCRLNVCYSVDMAM